MTFGLDLLGDQIASDTMHSGNWRNTMALRFRDDPRNEIAAQRLRTLAASPRDETSSIILGKILDHPRYSRIRKATSAACRDVAFRFHPESLNDLYSRILENLDEPAGSLH